MELALLSYTLLNVAIFAVVLLFVRASRARRAPDERRDLEENALLTVDWEVVRRERCLPSRCPRVVGQPPRPRKDVGCEICAATFLDQRLRRVLQAAQRPSSPTAEVDGPMQRSTPCLAVSADAPARPAAAASRRRFGRVRSFIRPESAMLRFGIGIGLVAGGALVAAFGGWIWLILPGYLMVLTGLGFIASAAASGAI